MKTLKAIAVTTLLAGSLPVYAGFMMGGPAEGATAAIETITSYTDEATAAALQTQQDAVADLQTQLDTLMDAEERDSDAISEARSQLREARHDLRDDISEVVDSNDELKTALQDQREAAHTERATNRYALQDETAYASLLSAATEEQAALLDTNQEAIDVLKTQASEARTAGASREEMGEIRDQIRTLASEQADVVGEVLESNEELQAEFSAAAEDVVSDMRPQRGGRHH